MRLYLAGSAMRHADIEALAQELRNQGHAVVSTWHNTLDVELEQRSDELLQSMPHLYREPVQMALAELRSADTIVVVTGGPGRGGRHVEFGYAIALGLHTIVIGPREHLFHTLVCEAYATVGEWLATMPDSRSEGTYPSNVTRLHGRA